jgi:hypothetical protein
MEKRFESELAKRISSGRGRASPFGAKFLALAISVCAVLAVATAAVLGAVATKPANAGPVEYLPIMDETNYIVYNAEDSNADGDMDAASAVHSDIYTDDFAVKREMTVKQGDWTAPGNPVMQWKKVVYTVNLRLRDLAYVDPVNGQLASVEPIGMIVGELSVAYGTATFVEMSESFLINGCEPNILDAEGNIEGCADAVEVASVEGQALVTITLPDLAGTVVGGYAEGDSISISVMLKAGFLVDVSVIADEAAFPEFDDLAIPDPVIVP